MDFGGRPEAGASPPIVGLPLGLIAVGLQDVIEADALVLGAPGRQGGMCGEMRMFLDSLADLQHAKGLKVPSL